MKQACYRTILVKLQGTGSDGRIRAIGKKAITRRQAIVIFLVCSIIPWFLCYIKKMN
jgi:hypothetical protein